MPLYRALLDTWFHIYFIVGTNQLFNLIKRILVSIQSNAFLKSQNIAWTKTKAAWKRWMKALYLLVSLKAISGIVFTLNKTWLFCVFIHVSCDILKIFILYLLWRLPAPNYHPRQATYMQKWQVACTICYLYVQYCSHCLAWNSWNPQLYLTIRSKSVNNNFCLMNVSYPK